MVGWQTVGRGILALVDALAAGAVAGTVAFLAVPVLWVSTRVELAITAGGLVTGVVLAVALALARRGQRPFPATRLARRAADRLPWWI